LGVFGAFLTLKALVQPVGTALNRVEIGSARKNHFRHLCTKKRPFWGKFQPKITMFSGLFQPPICLFRYQPSRLVGL
jgi:hypothetical protein